jgi:predicted DsbA family dithiol-disulfide isomerase
MRMLKEEFGDAVEVEWRAFLLRPRPQERTLEAFREYTQNWTRPDSQPDSGEFRVWSTDEGPPSHSVPPHLVAKAAATFGQEAFERVHDGLMKAYFTDNRDITAAETLRALWEEAELPPDGLARSEQPEILRQVFDEHNEAVECGANGVPAFRTEDNEAVITGAHPLELFRGWVNRLLGRSE